MCHVCDAITEAVRLIARACDLDNRAPTRDGDVAKIADAIDISSGIAAAFLGAIDRDSDRKAACKAFGLYVLTEANGNAAAYRINGSVDMGHGAVRH